MDIEISGRKLILEKPLREISNKRSTYLAQLDGQPVIVKGFYQPSRKYYLCECQMHTLLEADFCLPKIIINADNHPLYTGGVLVYEYIDAKSMGEHCKKTHLNTRDLFITSQVIKVLQQLEKYGIVHQDPHLANFLLMQNKVYLLDLSSLKQARMIDNVSPFLAQFPLSSYLELQFLNSEQSNQERVKSIYRKRKAQLYKKVLRDCSLVSEQQQNGDLLLINRNIKSDNSDTATQIEQLNKAANIHIQAKQNRLFPLISKNPFNNDLKIIWQSLHWLFLNQLTSIQPLALSYQAQTKSCHLWIKSTLNTTIQTRFSFLNEEDLHCLSKYLSSFGVIIDESR